MKRSAFSGRGRPLQTPIFLFQIEDDVLAHASDGGDAALCEGRGDFGWGRLQGLFFIAEPNGFDDVSGDALGEAAGYGFDFGEFGHGRIGDILLSHRSGLVESELDDNQRKSGFLAPETRRSK